MTRLTNTQKVAGELAIRSLSQKAQKGYADTDLLTVYELDDGEKKTYTIRGLFDADGLTRDELEEELEALTDAYEEGDDE